MTFQFSRSNFQKAYPTYRKVGETIKHLDGILLGSVIDVPMVDGGFRNQTQGLFAEPLPVHNILVHYRRLELLLDGEIENLDCPALSLEGDNVLAPVHDCTVGIDRPPHDLIVVLQVNNDDLWLVVLFELLANTDIVIRFEGLL
jgi:hypothetical protein